MASWRHVAVCIFLLVVYGNVDGTHVTRFIQWYTVILVRCKTNSGIFQECLSVVPFSFYMKINFAMLQCYFAYYNVQIPICESFFAGIIGVHLYAAQQVTCFNLMLPQKMLLCSRPYSIICFFTMNKWLFLLLICFEWTY